MDPKPPSSRLRQTQQEAADTRQETRQQAADGATFGSAEEALRFDAAQTGLPGAIEPRLQESVRREPPPARSWWRRWLGGH